MRAEGGFNYLDSASVPFDRAEPRLQQSTISLLYTVSLEQLKIPLVMSFLTSKDDNSSSSISRRRTL